jgi:hypothetical protein
MRDPLRQFWATFEEISLPPEKKAEGLQMLKTALKLMEEGQSIAVLDPARKASFQNELSAKQTDRVHHAGWFTGQWSVRTWLRIPAIAVLAIFIAMGTGIIGAEAALPGDFLYPVKISITEPLIGALHFSPEAQAQWQVRLLARRAREAERARKTRDAEAVLFADQMFQTQMWSTDAYISALPSPVSQAVLRDQVHDILSETPAPDAEASSSSSSSAFSSKAHLPVVSSAARSSTASSSSKGSHSSRSTYSVPAVRSTYGSPSLPAGPHSYGAPTLPKPQT